jgi:hypothetical protein
MNIDLKSAAIGLALGLVVCGGWYAGSTRPVIQKLVEEKAQAVARANQLEQDNAKMKEIAEHWYAVANSQPQAAVQSQQLPQDPTVATLNAIRPGLGTLASVVNQAWQQHQAQQPPKCPQGQFASRIGDQPWHCENSPVTTAQQQEDVHIAGAIWTDEGSTHGCAANQIFLSGTGCLTCAAALHPGVNERGSWGCVQ